MKYFLSPLPIMGRGERKGEGGKVGGNKHPKEKSREETGSQTRIIEIL
jgi:hypothetical protein